MAPYELEETGISMWYHEQKEGDLIIVPPMVPHTVINSVSNSLLNSHSTVLCCLITSNE